MNRDLGYVLNYMTKYAKNTYMHDSEPMLNYRDIEIVLKHIYELEQENKQLKEQLENDIDRYEDTISYQLGFDKGKEYLQQKIDKAIEVLKEIEGCDAYIKEVLEILGDKE